MDYGYLVYVESLQHFGFFTNKEEAEEEVIDLLHNHEGDITLDDIEVFTVEKVMIKRNIEITLE